jgi:hypothetical protein
MSSPALDRGATCSGHEFTHRTFQQARGAEKTRVDVPESTVTAEVASSSLVVPAIDSKPLVLIAAKPSRTQKGTFSPPFLVSLSL